MKKKVAFGSNKSNLTGPMSPSSHFRQGFVALGDFLISVSILFSTYKRINSGKIIVRLCDSQSKDIGISIFDAAILVDNAYKEIPLHVPLTMGKNYELWVTICHSGDDTPSCHIGQKTRGSYLFRGAILDRDKELTCKFCYTNVREEVPLGLLSGGEGEQLSSFLQDLPFVSIIILNKDKPELIKKCVEDIFHQADKYPFEVIIGDTGSTDESVWMFYKSLPEGLAKVVQGLEYHFSKNNNLLAKDYARGNYLLFLNNDVFLGEQSISWMIDVARVYKAGAIGLRLTKEGERIDHDGQSLYDARLNIVTPNHLNINRFVTEVPAENGIVQGVTGACMLTRKDLFLDLGGFDERYEDVYQDCDYSLELTINGFSCFVIREGNAFHVGNATRGPTTTDRESVVRDRRKLKTKWKRVPLPDKPLFSLITCVNNRDMYLNMVKSLGIENEGRVEFIPVLNQDNRYVVTEALNLGKKFAQGEYLVYCHQDIIFEPMWIARMSKVLEILERNGEIGFVGFEGMQDGGTPYSCRLVNPTTFVKVQTLDELCFVTPRYDLEFDEQFRFHYYGADICLQAEQKGLTNYLLGIRVQHLSGGAENILKDTDAFKLEARKMRKKYPNKNIWTTTTKFLDGGIEYMILPDILNSKEMQRR